MRFVVIVGDVLPAPRLRSPHNKEGRDWEFRQAHPIVNSTNGIYLLVYRGKQQSWQHPVTKEKLSFDKLIEELRKRAKELIENQSGIENIAVVGIDLTKRGAGNKRR